MLLRIGGGQILLYDREDIQVVVLRRSQEDVLVGSPHKRCSAHSFVSKAAADSRSPRLGDGCASIINTVCIHPCHCVRGIGNHRTHLFSLGHAVVNFSSWLPLLLRSCTRMFLLCCVSTYVMLRLQQAGRTPKICSAILLDALFSTHSALT
jgi:hypothetical protein